MFQMTVNPNALSCPFDPGFNLPKLLSLILILRTLRDILAHRMRDSKRGSQDGCQYFQL